ncbi:hypothetical protein EDB83DRAFT_2558479 [Lactarius deliciosus]|nr:hypothetical protein EDB83DRAFT_2558479 [Lactarius deliciosus]
MPALIPVDNTLGALFIGTVLSSIIYGVTWLQVYSYYNSHCLRDRWPLKFFVAFLMLVDSANLFFVVYTTYHVGITNFGDYLSDAFKPLVWGQTAASLSAIVLDVSVQHFYAYRIYRREFTSVFHLCEIHFLPVGRGSPYLPAAIVRIRNLFRASAHSHEQSTTSLMEFGIGILYSVKILKHVHQLGIRFQGLSIATLSCKVLCDVLITFGMVYYFLSNRTQVRRTNNVLNLLAIYAINCGTLHLVFAVSSVTLLAKYRDTLVSTPSLFIMFRLYLCAFMAILNSRDNLRETLDGPGGVVTTLTQLKARTDTTVPWGTQNTAEASTSAAIPKSRPPFSVYSDTSFSASVIAFEREMHPVPPVPEVVTIYIDDLAMRWLADQSVFETDWISQGYHNRRAPDLIFYDVYLRPSALSYQMKSLFNALS